MRPHVGVQVPLCLEHLPTHFAFGTWCPVVILVCNVQLVLSLTLVIASATSIVSAKTLRLLQPVDNKKVSGQRPWGGVAQATLLALEGGAIRLVLGNVLMESCDVLSGKAADRTFVNFEDIHFEPL